LSKEALREFEKINRAKRPPAASDSGTTTTPAPSN
jgi:hypothetical protein